jgi:hypothetical protein
MSFAPKWARPVAVIGLELNIARVEWELNRITDSEFGILIDDLKARIADLPRD